MNAPSIFLLCSLALIPHLSARTLFCLPPPILFNMAFHVSDVYLIGTVMLIFGLGLYELFVNSPPIDAYASSDPATPVRVNSSSFFGLFRLRVSGSLLLLLMVVELPANDDAGNKQISGNEILQQGLWKR